MRFISVLIEICLFLYINLFIVKNNIGGTMRKIILIVILFSFVTFVFSNTKESMPVFIHIDEEIYDNYHIEFKECILSTNNFVSVFSYFNDKDFKILEIIPYNNLNNKYLFYSNDLEYINNKFKNDYINIMLNEEKYITNICIKEVKINTSNYILNEFKNIIDFHY